jgi:hypothetical protein
VNLVADIKTLLTGIESNIFLGDKPETPDSLICIYPSGGYNPLVDHSRNIIDRPTFQIIVRDISYSSGITRCEAIKSTLNGISNQTINGSFYLSIYQQGDVLHLGKDTKNRTEFSINFRTQIRK